MALVSPGVQVTVTDQSNYAPNQIGSAAYILLATGQDKTAPGGGTAAGTTADNAGKIYAITSQRDLVTTFGTPSFHQTTSGAPINGGEQNEYGLLAAYHALGVSNQLYVQRAPIDLDALNGQYARPTGSVDSGTYWLDTSSTEWGIYEWDAGTQTFTHITPGVDTTALGANITTPPNTLGTIGQYGVTAGSSLNPVFYKGYDNTWTQVGSTEWQAQLPALTGTTSNPVVGANASIVINTTSIDLTTGTNVSSVADSINSAVITGVTARVATNKLVISITSDSASNGVDADGSANISFSSSGLGTTLGITAGQYWAPTTAFSTYFNQPEWLAIDSQPRPSGSIWVKTSALGLGSNYVMKQYSSVTEAWNTIPVGNYYSNGDATYAYDPTGGGTNIPAGTMWEKYNLYGDGTLSSSIWYRQYTGTTVITGATTAVDVDPTDTITFQVTQPGTTGYSDLYTIAAGGSGTPADMVAAILAENIPNISAAVTSDGLFTMTHLTGGDFRFVGDAATLSALGLTTSGERMWQSRRGTTLDPVLLGSNWSPLARTSGYTVSASTPYADAPDGKLWYWQDPTRVDIMINTGSAWKGYRNVTSDIRGYALSTTNRGGVIVSSTAPAAQDNGNPLVYGDLWLDTSATGLENYPQLSRYQSVNGVNQWVLFNNSDNLSQNGIVFADARWGTSANVDPALGTLPGIDVLTTSDYTDLDAPNPALYPRGMVLFNTRASGYNVKQWNAQHFTQAAYPNEELPAYEGTWVSVSGYDEAGIVPKFGRQATRSVVVAALKSAIDSSTALREEQNQFNIIACPGYPELIPNMLTLNSDRNLTAFVIGDTPLRLPATGTDIIAWANNSAGEAATNEGGLSAANRSPYMAVFYPHGQTTDLSGNAVVVPASVAMIRTFIKNDNQSYPWFAPAGARRGSIDTLDAIGYVDSASGAFVSIGVGQGLRDVMYNNDVNPLTVLPGIGLVNYGNKSMSGEDTALSRINVARLINYIRYQLDKIGRPFIFEPNDTITRNQVKAVVENLLNDLVTKRGVTDYLVVCDTTNNTPSRIAANELWVDVAVQPTKDVEFIYIPIRLTNAGQLQSNNTAVAANPGTGA